ncbi:pentapeptide repeat-containing protein [Paraclostridium bifermentans]|uniref:pentapeptide repeat-containing protein n=1 Tax=Paraclostridium bifermentans TaxID=1490 RepID=UPI00359C2DCA
MAYINFKEEAFVAKRQLSKRLENNEKLYNEIIKSKNVGKEYNPDIKYSYKVILSEHFGKNDVYSEDSFHIIQNKDIVCTEFKNCKFYGIKFKDCKFIGCKFTNCEFCEGGVVFESCTFFKEDSQKVPSLNVKDNLSCEFNNCNMYIKFEKSTLSFSVFKKCNIQYTNFENCDMSSLMIIYSKLKNISIQDCDLSGFKIISTYIKDFEFNDKDKSKLDEKSFIDKIPIITKSREEYEGLYMIYQNIADKFKENSLNNNFGEYYYLCKSMQRKSLKLLSKISSYIYWITCGYGERPWNAVISSLMIIFIFALVYLFIGVEINGEVVRYDVSAMGNLNQTIKDFNETLSLSIGCFGGLGTINCEPVPIAYTLVNIEILIGITMQGIGIGTLTRKVVR